MSNNTSRSPNQIGDYTLENEIGKGGFATVYQGTHIPTGEKVAIKIIDKTQLQEDQLNLKRLESEISILKIVKHKNIISLYEILETPEKIYLIMELCEKGELFDYIVSQKKISENQSCIFFQEIIDTIEYLNNQNISHRDIKPENMLLTEISKKNKNLEIKLIDFGISIKYDNNNKLLSTPCGTTTYAPPEMHKGEKYYGLLCDIWSAGVVLYAMVYGYLPFCDDDNDVNIKNIINGNYDLENDVSEDVRDLIKNCMNIDPNLRYDITSIKKHKWFNLVKDSQSRPGIIFGINVIPVDLEVVWYCKEFGFDDSLVVNSVKNNLFDRNYAIYYILLRKMIRNGYESISDLRSEKFLEFINNKDNLVVNQNERKNKNCKNNDKGNRKNKFNGKVNGIKNKNLDKNNIYIKEKKYRKLSDNNSDLRIQKIRNDFNFYEKKSNQKKNNTIGCSKINIDKKKYKYKNNNQDINIHPIFEKEISSFIDSRSSSFIEKNNNILENKNYSFPKNKINNNSTRSFDKSYNNSIKNLKRINQNFSPLKEIKVNKKNNINNNINDKTLINEKEQIITHNRNSSALQSSLRNKNKLIFNSNKNRKNSISPTSKQYKKKNFCHKNLLQNKIDLDSSSDKRKSNNNLPNQLYIQQKKIDHDNMFNKTLVYNEYVLFNNKKKLNLKTNFIDSQEKSKDITPNNNMNNMAISFLKKTKKKQDDNKINNIIEVKKNHYKKLNNNLENNYKNNPKVYKGPIDLRCIFLNTINEVTEHIERILIQKKLFYSKINQYKYYCSKNGDIFEIEINSIDNNIEKQQIYYICVLSKQGNIRTNNKFVDLLFPILNKKLN